MLVAAGAFLVTLALLLPGPVHGRSALVPDSGRLSWRLEADSARYLDTATWRTREDAELVRRIDAVGSPAAGSAGRAVWDVRTATTGPDGTLGHLAWRVAVDRSSGEAVRCCGAHVDGDHLARPHGLTLWWPPGAGAAERPLFDPESRTSAPAVPDGADLVSGVPTERYVQTVAATRASEPARPVPARLFDADARGTVGAERWLEVERVYWVEPLTGRVVQLREQRRETLRPEEAGPDGETERVLLAADFQTPPEEAAANAAAADRRALLLRLTSTDLPAALGGAGALLVLVGVLRRAHRPDRRRSSAAGRV
ncbi:DUF3068 domain-containing protein [Marinitenerispora sediminis]|uniref:DUF3068 domain-containing protein n=1 Tax=Marinitenerispora sediminis TaxID=1931232 RepID=UPI00131487C7|nr:DUF3068 domain-containing protein [Marinitenerispora sediminis]